MFMKSLKKKILALNNYRILLLALFLVFMLALVLVAGCPQQDEDEEEAELKKEEIILVLHTSLTGGLADYGYAQDQAAKLAVKDMSPFRVGDTEYTIKLVTLDDKGDPAESAVVAQNAVDQEAIAVIGPLTSGNTNAALPVYEKESMPLISSSATLPDLTDAGHENFFRTCIRDDIQGMVLGEWTVELGFKKVVVMDDKGDYAVGLADITEKTIKDKGVETLREHTTEGAVDFSAQINNIRKFGADVVDFTGYHREAGLLTKQLAEAGLGDIQIMGGDGIKSEEIFKEAGGDNAEGMLCTFGLDQGAMPGYDDFKSKYEDQTGKEGTGPYAENTYDAIGILIEAIKEAKSIDGKEIIDALHEVEYDGVLGTFSFDDKGDIDISPGISKFVAKDGKWVPYEEE